MPTRSPASSRCGSGAGSGLRMAKMKMAEARKLSASKKMAMGAPSRPTSPPPTGGPATKAAERLISSLALPSTSRSRSTSAGRYDW